MIDKFEAIFFGGMSIMFLALAVLSACLCAKVAERFEFVVYACGSIGAYIAMLLALNMVKEIVVKAADAEEKEKERQSSERIKEMEIKRSEQEAERIRASTKNKIVIDVCGHDE